MERIIIKVPLSPQDAEALTHEAQDAQDAIAAARRRQEDP